MNTNDKEFCRRIEKIIFIDPGKRGIEQCFIYDSLYRAAEGILKCDKKKISLVLSHVNEQPMKIMEKSGFDQKIGNENICAHIDDALARAEVINQGTAD